MFTEKGILSQLQNLSIFVNENYKNKICYLLKYQISVEMLRYSTRLNHAFINELPSAVLNKMPQTKINLNRQPFQLNQSLTSKLKFYDSSVMFKMQSSYNPDIPYPQYIGKLINQYPYCNLPKITQNFSDDKTLTGDDYKKWVAFTCFFTSEHKQHQLKQMKEILIGKFDHQGELTGVKVFTSYYMTKLPEIMSKLQDKQQFKRLKQSQKIYYFQILANLQKNAQIALMVSSINQKLISPQSPRIKSLYLKVLIHQQLPYIGFVDKLYDDLTRQIQSKIQKQKKLEASKVLITINNYQQSLPQRLKDFCVNTFTSNVNSIDAFDHWMIIKYLYMNNSYPCKVYIQKLTQIIINHHKQLKGEGFHVPLILKVLKYRSKLKLPNQIFRQLIQSHPQKFNTVFKQSKNFNKEIFMSVMTSERNQALGHQIRAQFCTYVVKTFSNYQKCNQLDEVQFIRNLKLVHKYGRDIAPQDMEKVVDILASNLYDRFEEVASQQLKYYIFLVVFTFMKPEYYLSNTSKLNKIITATSQHNHKECLSNPTIQSISKMANIEYQKYRNMVDQSLMVNIFQYNYKNIVLLARSYSNMFYIMKKSKAGRQQKVNFLNSQKKEIYNLLSKGQFSLKVIYTMVDVLHFIQYKDQFIYSDVQRSIAKVLKRNIQYNQRIYLLPKDVIFLKNKLVKTGQCSQKLEKFLYDMETNYSLMNQHIKQFTSKVQNYQNMRNNEKYNKQQTKQQYSQQHNGQNYVRKDREYKNKNASNPRRQDYRPRSDNKPRQYQTRYNKQEKSQARSSQPTKVGKFPQNKE